MNHVQIFNDACKNFSQSAIRIAVLLSLILLCVSCALFAPIEQPEDTPGPHFPENETCSPYKGTMSCDKGMCTPDYGRTDCELRSR